VSRPNPSAEWMRRQCRIWESGPTSYGLLEACRAKARSLAALETPL
jgi:hypothetical protein